MNPDLIYFRRRAAEEVGAAASAPDLRVRNVHLELARGYEERCSIIEAQQVMEQATALQPLVPAD